MLYQGKIIADAPPDEFRHLSDPRVQQFLHGQAHGPLTDGDGETKSRVKANR
jgi:phospholipid/cholesterol/gamma-HCH transport system ATP-binding protein